MDTKNAFGYLSRISVVLVALFCCSFHGAAQPLTLNAKVKGFKTVDKLKCLAVKLSLKNNTPDTIRYYNMNCSRDAAYTTDCLELEKKPMNCPADYPVAYVLRPNSKEEKVLYFIVPNKKLKGTQFRVGFNYVDPKKTSTTSFTKLMRKIVGYENLVWSNTLVYPGK